MGVAMRGIVGTATLGLAALLAANSAAAAPSSKSDWVSYPSHADWAAAPPASYKEGVFARAAARCAVKDSGELSDCRVVRETPVGAGVGEALLAMVPKYRRKPPGKDDLREIVITGDWYAYDTAGDWRRRPSPEQLRAVFPAEAYKRGSSGTAVIDCVATVQGALNDCIVLDESPVGMGFGGAAIALTPQFLMKPAQYKGAPTPSTVRIPIRWESFGPQPTAGSKKVMPANVAWTEAPSYAEVAAAYPKKAREERKAGRATVACGMSEEGRLRDCSIATSDPRGYGFDLAAKTLAKRFAYPVGSDADRKATRGVIVHLPITFDPANLDQASPVVGKPNWAAIPSADMIRAAFKDIKGAATIRAMLSCVVQPGGALAGCTVASQEPAGAGAAALTLVPTFRVTTWTTEGLPVVGGTIRIPLRYELDAEPAPK